MLSTDIRNDFPILNRIINDRRIIYLDSSATTLKPQSVIDATMGFYTECTANVHRAVHALSEIATDSYEGAREKMARFLNADSREIAFVKNATEALNLVANSLEGKVAFALTEHHSNLLPWRKGKFILLKTNPNGVIDLAHAKQVIEEGRPALVAVSYVSNALGIRQPIEQLTEIAHSVNAMVLLDLSQAVGHIPIDVLELNCDLACFSGHKMLGPSGVGVLYQREGMDFVVNPFFLGGEMVHEVHADSFEARPWPWCLEAGTPNIEGVIGLGAACDYIESVGVNNIEEHCTTLARQLSNALREIDGITLITDPDESATSIVTFYSSALPAHGVARILSNRHGIMIRSGYHCAQPYHEASGWPETMRASFHIYNTPEEVSALADAIRIIVG